MSYQSVTGYTAPSNENVTITAGQTLTLSRSYIPTTGSVQINLTPSGVGGWRVDSGAWQANGATVGNLASGQHIVDYEDVTGYNKPFAETVAVMAGQTVSLNRGYTTVPANLTLPQMSGASGSTVQIPVTVGQVNGLLGASFCVLSIQKC